MDPFFNGTGKTGTGQVSFTRKNLSEPFHLLSEPFHLFRSCKRALNFCFCRLLSYEWFRNLTFMVVIALLITASSFFGRLHSHTSSFRSILHRLDEMSDSRWSRGTKILGTRVWLPHGNLRRSVAALLKKFCN